MPPEPAKKSDNLMTTRMSFAGHLEELRRRLILALVGLVLAIVICFRYGDRIIEVLTTPYCVAMEQLGFDARMIQLNPIESFIEYFKIALKFGLVLAAPWILFQIWRFVESGLFPAERRVVKYIAPSSVILFVGGSSFMVLVVLSGLLKFLIAISTWFPLPSHDSLLYRIYAPAPRAETVTSEPVPPAMNVPILPTDPKEPSEGQAWFNPRTQRLNIHHQEQTYFLRLQKSGDRQFVQPFFSIGEYLGFVVNMALAFGFGFQIPIVVVFLTSTRILSPQRIASARKYVILVVAMFAAVLTPTPDVGTMMLLAVPMYLLFEAGLGISRLIQRRAA